MREVKVSKDMVEVIFHAMSVAEFESQLDYEWDASKEIVKTLSLAFPDCTLPEGWKI